MRWGDCGTQTVAAPSGVTSTTRPAGAPPRDMMQTRTNGAERVVMHIDAVAVVVPLVVVVVPMAVVRPLAVVVSWW